MSHAHTMKEEYEKSIEEFYVKLAKKEKVELEYFGYFSAGIKNCAAEGEIIFAVKELTN